MNVVNLTPHDIIIMDDERNVIRTFERSSNIARVATNQTSVEPVDGVPAVKTVYGEVKGLPDPQPNTVYLVSLVVGNLLAGQRDDLYGPDSSPAGAFRDDKGNIIGSRRFVKY